MKILDGILELLYPTRCVFCRALTGGGSEPVCRKCLKKLPYASGDGQRQKLPFIPLCVSPLYYEGEVRQSLLRYKFHGAAAYSRFYGEILSKCIDENEISCDIITWVPLSRRRLRRRGYDQAGLIAAETARRSGADIAALLKKTRDNPPQSGTGSPEKRRANVAGVYRAAAPEAVSGKMILIVDDIVTTGATLSECARVLSAAGAAEIYAATVARTRE